MVSDIVLDKELPESLRNSIEAYVSCVAGASPKSEYLDLIRASVSEYKYRRRKYSVC